MPTQDERRATAERLRQTLGWSYKTLADKTGRSTMAVYNTLQDKPMMVGHPDKILANIEGVLEVGRIEEVAKLEKES